MGEVWAGQLSRYSDWLQAGQSGDRIPVGGEIFRTCPDRPWGLPSLLYNGYRVFPGGKERPGRDANPSPLSSAVVMKGQNYTSSPPIHRTACTEPQCLYKGALYLTSVPVQGCTLPLPYNLFLVVNCLIFSAMRFRSLVKPPPASQATILFLLLQNIYCFFFFALLFPSSKYCKQVLKKRLQGFVTLQFSH